MADLIELKSVKEFAKAIELPVATVTQRLALEVFTGVVKRTPVKKGRARSGWQLAIGEIPTGNPPFSASPPPTPSVQGIDGKRSVFIVNNVSYVVFLEAGHSRQAPSGMVAVTMAGIQGRIDAIIKAAS